MVSDLARITETVEFIQRNDTASVLAGLLPSLSEEERASMAGHCRFGHAAVLVFPSTLDSLADELRANGFAVGDWTPSVVVRERLSQRYGVPLADLEVGILWVPVGSATLEILALAGSGHAAIADDERAHSHETHVALEIAGADHIVLSGLRTLVADRAGLRPDGGGYNQHENSTVLYFRDWAQDNPLHRRLELISRGHYPAILDIHMRQSRPAADHLLELLTGAWETQAIAVAAELKLADRLAAGPLPATQLATLTGAHPESLRRLLRYLDSLGIVRVHSDDVSLTELGQLLRSDVRTSLHPLAQLYGGLFYESFGNLSHSVRTGGDAFAHHFGQHHFDYIAERPELADLFDRGMASSAAVFGHVARMVDFTTANVIVDVAGGNGELLRQVLLAAPHAHGVLLERAHAIEAARANLAQVGRCELITGDFTEQIPPAGDVYLLSRILHDWDDKQCQAILRRCAAAMPEHAELLIVERLLPEDDSPSLAVAWDVHMMCNVGGQERTASEYRELLAGAGFELTTWHDLPLDFALLRARLAGGHHRDVVMPRPTVESGQHSPRRR